MYKSHPSCVDVDWQSDRSKTVHLRRDARIDLPSRNQRVWVCASVGYWHASGLNDLDDSWCLDILTWAPAWYRNFSAIGWAIHAVDGSARAVVPKANPSLSSLLSMRLSKDIEYAIACMHLQHHRPHAHAGRDWAVSLYKKYHA
jgi:hypothetical protein